MSCLVSFCLLLIIWLTKASLPFFVGKYTSNATSLACHQNSTMDQAYQKNEKKNMYVNIWCHKLYHFSFYAGEMASDITMTDSRNVDSHLIIHHIKLPQTLQLDDVRENMKYAPNSINPPQLGCAFHQIHEFWIETSHYF